MTARCNVLFIMADQFRRDGLVHLGGYGRTAALDALAREGTSLRGAITNSPICVAARFALASGLYPHQTGVWSTGPFTLAPKACGWTRALADAGYRTSLFGKTHFHQARHADLRDGLDLVRSYGLMDVDEIGGPRANAATRSAMTDGWDAAGLLEAYRDDMADREATPWIARPSPLGVERYYDTYVGQRALDYLTSYDRPEPWFCWVSFGGPHEPWDAPVPYDRMHAAADAPAPIPRSPAAADYGGLLAAAFQLPEYAAPGPDEVAALRANYAGNITLIDDQVGAILEALKRKGRYDDTLIVFTSDHGEMNGDHGLLFKSNFTAQAVDIPLVVRPPRGEPVRPDATDALVELIDVGPTILDYAGIDRPTPSEGRSIRPVVAGATDSHRDYVVAEFHRHMMIATSRWKLEVGQDKAPALLIDRREDRFEQCNLIGREDAAEALADMQAKLAGFRAATTARHNILL